MDASKRRLFRVELFDGSPFEDEGSSSITTEVQHVKNHGSQWISSTNELGLDLERSRASQSRKALCDETPIRSYTLGSLLQKGFKEMWTSFLEGRSAYIDVDYLLGMNPSCPHTVCMRLQDLLSSYFVE